MDDEKVYREPTPEELVVLESLDIPRVGCRCAPCRKLCSDGVPGCPTLEEAKVLLGMGLANKMMLRGCNIPAVSDDGEREWREVQALMPAIRGSEGKDVPWWPQGRCALLNYGGLCSVHPVKPLECATATGCDKSVLRTQEGNKLFDTWREERIFATWDTEEGRQVVEEWKRAVGYEYGR